MEYQETDTLIGNQFVWIPVASESDLERITNDSFPSNQCTEPFNFTNNSGTNYKGYTTEEMEYNTMKEQVLKYGGFYIGRYEAGVDSIELRTQATSNQKVVCKKGVAPYNYIPWGASMNDVDSEISCEISSGLGSGATTTIKTNGAVYLSKNMYASSESVTSTLCYGCQWDAMCRYIEDRDKQIGEQESVKLTGSEATDISKNIYDLAGNCMEWTMEAYVSNTRFLRGGDYGNPLTIFSHSCMEPYKIYTMYSFRPTLYIK